VHAYLANESYWANHRSREETRAANAASWCFTLIDEATGGQVGFARLVTDRVTYGWLADVFVATEYQGRGLGVFLVGTVAEAASGINRLQLGTRDAHTLYAKVGFAPHTYPDRAMERLLRPLSPPI
jgi:GNAT superfamily N-acetyltransferase